VVKGPKEMKDKNTTPRSRVLPEKLKCLKKFPAFYGTRRFITIYTRARHLSLSLAISTPSTPPPPPPSLSKIHFNITFPSMPGSSIRRLQEMIIYLQMYVHCWRRWFQIMTQLIKNIYETGEWLKDLMEVTMIALKKKPKATKHSDHCTVSLIRHTANIVARTKRKIEDVLGDQFSFRRGKVSRDAIGMLTII
jgi:hypothetical protein